MAEVAAGLWAAEEVVTTGVQAGIGAYMVAKPTMPLKATFTQIPHSNDGETKALLARSGHSLSVVGNKAYVFGGETAAGKLAGNEVHSISLPTAEKSDAEYDSASAEPHAEDGQVPAARKRHAACALTERMVIFGGLSESGELISENSKLWLYDTGKSKWEEFEASDSEVFPKPRSDARLFMAGDPNRIVLYGGVDADGAALKDVWNFNLLTRKWSELPEAPVSTSHAALTDGVLYIVSGSESISGDLHILPLSSNVEEEPSWSTVNFPTNPLTPGPAARTSAGLVPVSTGYGRQYLVYLFGALVNKPSQTETLDIAENAPEDKIDKAQAPEYCADVWTYQLPSSNPEIKPTTNFTEAIKPAKIKDAIRKGLGLDSGKHSWSEVEVVPPTDPPVAEGKVHPGPRASFACDVMPEEHSVVVWGGINPKGELEGDGWIIKLE